jgi:hypothetical protein
MSTEAAHFIVKLATDPVLLSRYRDNPMAVLNESGLSAMDVDILSSRDADSVRKHLGGPDARLGKGHNGRRKRGGKSPSKKAPSKKRAPNKKKPSGKKV